MQPRAPHAVSEFRQVNISRSTCPLRAPQKRLYLVRPLALSRGGHLHQPPKFARPVEAAVCYPTVIERCWLPMKTLSSQGFHRVSSLNSVGLVLAVVLPTCCPTVINFSPTDLTDPAANHTVSAVHLAGFLATTPLRVRAVFALTGTRFAATAGTAFADVRARAALAGTAVLERRVREAPFSPGLTALAR